MLYMQQARSQLRTGGGGGGVVPISLVHTTWGREAPERGMEATERGEGGGETVHHVLKCMCMSLF